MLPIGQLYSKGIGQESLRNVVFLRWRIEQKKAKGMNLRANRKLISKVSHIIYSIKHTISYIFVYLYLYNVTPMHKFYNTSPVPNLSSNRNFNKQLIKTVIISLFISLH